MTEVPEQCSCQIDKSYVPIREPENMNKAEWGGSHYSPSTREAEAEGSGVQAQSKLHSEFKAILGYTGEERVGGGREEEKRGRENGHEKVLLCIFFPLLQAILNCHS